MAICWEARKSDQQGSFRIIFETPQIPYAVYPFIWIKIWYFAKESNSEIPCLVIELPVQIVRFGQNPAYNGEVLAGAIFQGYRDESKIIPWEVVLREIEELTL